MFIEKFSADKEWTIFEEKIAMEKMGFYETLFTLGNGYVGSRGILEEGYEKAYPGTYFAGVYNKHKGRPSEIVNAPNPVCLEIYVEDKKLSANNMKVLKHRRMLDIKRALLIRRTVFMYGDKRYEYESMRFFSIRHIHLAIMTFSFRSLDSDVRVVIRQIMDATSRNEVQPDGSKPIKHYEIKRKLEGNGKLYLEAKTKESGISIGMAGLVVTKGMEIRPDGKTALQRESIEKEFSFLAKRGKRYTFDKYISLYTSRDGQDVKNSCFRELEFARRKGVIALLGSHVKEWEKRWQVCDIKIKGDPSDQLALRFNAYHLLIAAPPKGVDASIPAKALSGEWYKGHIFWDTEIYVLPFFMYTQPEIAKNLLLYRARRIEEAKKGAKVQGYKGALWPWESALTGKDETPDRWLNIDGTITPVYNKIREHHIASNVIYAVAFYYQVSKDDDFMLRYGLEMVFETARFWASRVIYNDKKERYEIKRVIGPNEFQDCVDNNSYTNYLAKWLMNYATQLYYNFKRNHPYKIKNVIKRIGLKQEEITRWQEISENILFLQQKDGLIEEFEDFFRRKDVIIKRFKENGMPIWPSSVKVSEVKDTQLVKQADVILLLHLFSYDFSKAQKRINFEYYHKRTTHKSSLSIPSYAIIGVELDRFNAAYQYFSLAVNSDLKNIYGNTEQGIHAASLGGAWQIVINGFSGLKLKNDMLSINPRLPEKWEELRFRIWFRKALLEVTITRNRAKVSVIKDKAKTKGSIDIKVLGKRRYIISRGKSISGSVR